MPRSGPSAQDIHEQSDTTVADYSVIDINRSVVQTLAANQNRSLAKAFSKSRGRNDQAVAVGDVVAVSIYEASSGGLFNQGDSASVSGGVNSQLPPQVVDPSGRISIPYVGPIKVASLTLREIEKTIQSSLGAKAIDPQVVATVADKRGTAVTVGGDVSKPGRVQLQTGAERLLDVVSLAGGTTGPAYESSVQVTRGSVKESMLLSDVVSNPRENIYLTTGDSVFISKAPRSYVIMGATMRSSEVPFGIERLSLAQAVARAGGLNDRTADPGGVFLFRFETPTIADKLSPGASARFPGQRRIPVVYRANLRDPNTLFNIQAFEVRNGDLLYIANAETAQLQKFMDLIGSGVGIVRSGEVLSNGFN